MTDAPVKQASWAGVMLNLLFASAVMLAFGTAVSMLAVFPDYVLRFHFEPEQVSGMTHALWQIAPHSIVGLLGTPLVFWTVFCWASRHLPDGMPLAFALGMFILVGSLWIGREVIWWHSELLAVAPTYFQTSRTVSDVLLMMALFLETGRQHNAWKRLVSQHKSTA